MSVVILQILEIDQNLLVFKTLGGKLDWNMYFVIIIN